MGSGLAQCDGQGDLEDFEILMWDEWGWETVRLLRWNSGCETGGTVGRWEVWGETWFLSQGLLSVEGVIHNHY